MYFSVVSWIFPCFMTARRHIVVATLLGTKGIKQSHSGDLHLHLGHLHATIEFRTLQISEEFQVSYWTVWSGPSAM